MTISPDLSIPSGTSNPSRAIPSQHIPSLDGLRAICILLVLIGHLNHTNHFLLHHRFLVVGDVAHLGVGVFFAISGFLITSLMIKEYNKTGGVSLKLFYARRALRIFPASYAYIGVVLLLSSLSLIALHPHDILFAATYTMNYSLNRSWYVGHLWSLSVEEQFYLLWPLAFTRLGPNRSVKVILAVLVIAPLARLTVWALFRGTPYFDLETFPTVADSLAIGCLLACCREWLERQTVYLRLFRPACSLMILGLVLIVNGLAGHAIIYPLGMTVVNLGIAILIHRTIYCSSDRLGRVLNWKPIATIGVLSYSLYVWQQLFLNRNSNGFEATFPQNLLFACLAAVLSYMLLEKPLMKLRGRLRSA